MTGSGPKLGVLLLLAVLLQTVVVTITVLHFTTALNSVRKTKCGGSDEPERRSYASPCGAHRDWLLNAAAVFVLTSNT